jgi:hypothetical protein
MIYEKDVERINELGYPGNIGLQELILFQDKANEKEKKEMDKAIRNED